MEPKLKDKAWNKELEKKVADKWKKEGVYKTDAKAAKLFTIDTPPPYPSGRPWHIGAAAHYSQIDMIARTLRMQGHTVYFPMGIDRNGLPVELYTEKKHNISLKDMPREKFINLCKTSLDDLEAEMIKIMKDMGLSCDFSDYYRTDSEDYRKLTQATFIELWRKGMIYEATRPNNYCSACKTTIADAEVLYEEKEAQLVYMRFDVEGKELVIASTRPELLFACQAVLVHPDDKRFKQLHGKQAQDPLFGRKIRIIPHPQVKPEFGSGVEMVCSYGDYADVRLFRELVLEEIKSVDEAGKLTPAAGKYAGLPVKEARKRIIEDLESAGLIKKVEAISHRAPLCERSKTTIEIIPMKELYLKQLDFIPQIKRLARSLKFHPEVHRQILLNWIDSVTIDWPISRRRYYATEIPIWYCKKCREAIVPKPGRYYRPWREKPPTGKCKCGSLEFTGEERTFDTWFDSSISPLFISKYGLNERFHKKTYPNILRPQAKEIVRTWLYYTLLRCWQLTKKQPWEHAWVMGYGVDEEGKKMSKSKGNVVDPIPVLERWGADAFRFWNASEANLGQDFRYADEKIEAAGKFLVKLWNVARFISSFPAPKSKPARLEALDMWILTELNSLIKTSLEGYKDFNFYIPANEGRNFVWNILAPHYLELVKARAYGEGFSKQEQAAAVWTLYHCLELVLAILAPITPFITDHIFREIFGRCVHTEGFPSLSKAVSRLKTDDIVSLDSMVWKAKKDSGMSLNAETKSLTIPPSLKSAEKDIKRTHNVSEIKYGKLEVMV